jgi:Flp pilus assembly pilin Flp
MSFPKNRNLRNFLRREEGMVSVEFAILLPILLFVFAMIVTYFDAFRQQTANLKAAYTVSDLISRQTEKVNADYIDTMHSLHGHLVRSDSIAAMRISVVHWSEEDSSYHVDWSVERGGILPVWTDATVSVVASQLPELPDEERVILVETRNSVTPIFNIGLPLMNIDNFVFSRPRFASTVQYESDYTPRGVHDDGMVEEELEEEDGDTT